MHCLGCDYDLRGGPGGTCPECGRAFDLGDRRTWSDGRSRVARRWTKVGAVVLVPGPLWSVAGMLAEYGLAWAVLGHRPRPSIDDPRSISLVNDALHMGVGVLMLAAPLLSWGAVVLAILGRSAGLDRRFSTWMIVIAVLAWPGAAVGIGTLVTPHIGVWWMD